MKYYSISCGSIAEARALEVFIRAKIAYLEKEHAFEPSPIIGKILPDNTLQLIFNDKGNLMAEVLPKIEEIPQPETPTSIHPTLLMPIKDIKMSGRLRHGLEQINGMECLGDMLAIRRHCIVLFRNFSSGSWQELVDIVHQFGFEPESMEFGWKIGGIQGKLTPEVLYLPLWGLNIPQYLYRNLDHRRYRSDGDIARFGDLLTSEALNGKYRKIVEPIVRGYGFEPDTLPEDWRNSIN